MLDWMETWTIEKLSGISLNLHIPATPIMQTRCRLTNKVNTLQTMKDKTLILFRVASTKEIKQVKANKALVMLIYTTLLPEMVDKRTYILALC